MRRMVQTTLSWRFKRKSVVIFSGIGLLLFVALTTHRGITPKFRFNYNDTFFAVPEKPADIVSMLKEQKCKIPVVNPYNPDILSHLVPSQMEECRAKRYGDVVDGVLRLKVNNVVSAKLYYIRRVDDFTISYSDAVVLASSWSPKSKLFCQH